MKAQAKNKPLTNIEKLSKVKMDNKLIINPPKSFNNLLYERYGIDKFSITVFNPFGYKARMIVKEIGIIPLAFLTYKLLMSKRPPKALPKGKKGTSERFKPKRGIM